MRLDGVLCSGLGEGAAFTGLAWARAEFNAKLGFDPHPGTFNLRLQGRAWEAARARLKQAPGIGIEPPAGFCAAKCFPVEMPGGIHGAAVIPEVPGYPADKLELLAPVALREALGMAEGDRLAFRLKGA